MPPRSRCPRDGTPLRTSAIGGLRVEFCSSCQGFASTRADIALLLEHHRRGTDWPRSGAPPRDVEIREGTMTCTCSPSRMSSVRRGPVMLDVCKVCGAVWFDRGEVRAVAAARRKGNNPELEWGDELEHLETLVEIAWWLL